MAILVVDDSEVSRTLLIRLLQKAGYPSVYGAASAEAAYEALGSDQDDAINVELILMDIILPEIDGIAACRAIKQNPRFADIPILMVTSLVDTAPLEAAFEAGASDYITKPVRKLELLARVRHALQLKHEIDQRKAREQELLEAKQQLERLADLLRHQAHQDVLTGIANRRSFDAVLAREWTRAVRNRRPLALLFADVDYFKIYNDTYGHQQGDECLRRIAEVVAAGACRATDQVARYGGEEFAVLLPDTDLEGAMGVGERIRQSVAALQIPHAGSLVQPYVTLSVGMASLMPTTSLSAADLVALADSALYRAKGSGRNCVKPPASEPGNSMKPLGPSIP